MYSDEFKRNALELAETTSKSDAHLEMSSGLFVFQTSSIARRVTAPCLNPLPRFPISRPGATLLAHILSSVFNQVGLEFANKQAWRE